MSMARFPRCLLADSRTVICHFASRALHKLTGLDHCSPLLATAVALSSACAHSIENVVVIKLKDVIHVASNTRFLKGTRTFWNFHRIHQ
jgi:hypothetical protein